jgi:hypothetical protein
MQHLIQLAEQAVLVEAAAAERLLVELAALEAAEPFSFTTKKEKQCLKIGL